MTARRFMTIVVLVLFLAPQTSGCFLRDRSSPVAFTITTPQILDARNMTFNLTVTNTGNTPLTHWWFHVDVRVTNIPDLVLYSRISTLGRMDIFSRDDIMQPGETRTFPQDVTFLEDAFERHYPDRVIDVGIHYEAQDEEVRTIGEYQLCWDYNGERYTKTSWCNMALITKRDPCNRPGRC